MPTGIMDHNLAVFTLSLTGATEGAMGRDIFKRLLLLIQNPRFLFQCCGVCFLPRLHVLAMKLRHIKSKKWWEVKNSYGQLNLHELLLHAHIKM